MINRDTVVHVAELASLSLGDDEIDSLTRELEAIVQYVAELEAVDTEGVAPMTSAQPTPSPLRADVAHPGLTREQALAQAPRASDDGFVVPKFVEPT